MACFDAYIMVDWSGGDGRRGGRADCIWVAHGAARDRAPATTSPWSRSEAAALLRQLLVQTGRKVLVCADFAYGYPAGFAGLLASPGRGARPWLRVWQRLARDLRDDIGTRPGAAATNRSNRFDVAAAINAGAAAEQGPFWCHFDAGRSPHIPQRQPAQPFTVIDAAGRARRIESLRRTDRRAGSDTAFRLFGTGSVGSQALTGIPRIAALRFDDELRDHSAVWPFETGWSTRGQPWPPRGVRILHAEIYPSLLAPRRDRVKDRGQVRALWHWARDLDRAGMLAGQFARPCGLRPGSRQEALIRGEEGWILGCPAAD